MAVVHYTKDVRELLHGKTVGVIGSSIQRSVYKDLVLMLQDDRYLTEKENRKKGEETFLNDELLYGGVKGERTNSKNYRECRSFYMKRIDTFIDYFFVTRAYSDYVEYVLNNLSDKSVDVVIASSCLWDVHRHYDSCDVYEGHLKELVVHVLEVLPQSLFIWLTQAPVDIRSKGGFKENRTDLVKVEEVKIFNTIARRVFLEAGHKYGRFVVIDLENYFQNVTFDRKDDGVHWNARAHRHISNLILEEISKNTDQHDMSYNIARGIPLNPNTGDAQTIRYVDAENDVARGVEYCDYAVEDLWLACIDLATNWDGSALYSTSSYGSYSRGKKRALCDNDTNYQSLMKRPRLSTTPASEKIPHSYPCKDNRLNKSNILNLDPEFVFPMIDCGVNLTNPKLKHDAEAVIARARSVGVEKLVVTCLKMAAAESALQLTFRHKGVVFLAAGVHPYFVKDEWNNNVINQLEKLLSQYNNEIVAIGECGLDYHKLLSPRPLQRGAFMEHVQLAVRYQKPLLVHERDAHEDVLEILEDFAELPPVVIHCFTGSMQHIRTYVNKGFYIGVTGFLSKKVGVELCAAISCKVLPIDRIIVQSNGPYMTPSAANDVDHTLLKHCGKRNEPCTLPVVVRCIAQCLSMNSTDVARVCNSNARKVFGVTV